MSIVICTLKSWNNLLAEKLAEELGKQGCSVSILTKKEELTKEALEALQPEYVFFPHWSYIIPADIYDSFECIVFHMTDLPYGRGGSPLQNLIQRGHKDTVISAIRVEAGLDTGPIYLKHPLSLEGSAQEIYRRAADIIFSVMIPEILKERMTPQPQMGEVVEFARRKPSQSELNGSLSLRGAYDLIRMLDAEGYPKAYVQVGDMRIEFDRAKFVDGHLVARAIFSGECDE